MGTCYGVELKATIKKGVEMDLKNTIESLLSSYYREEVKFDTMEEAINEIFFRNEITTDYSGDGVIHTYGGFDASYGYECLLIDGIEGIAKYLENGSYLSVYPEEGHFSYRVINGVAK